MADYFDEVIDMAYLKKLLCTWSFWGGVMAGLLVGLAVSAVCGASQCTLVIGLCFGALAVCLGFIWAYDSSANTVDDYY